MVTFVRYGEKVAEPIVEEGQADVLIAFERLEALRICISQKRCGVVIVNDWRIDPITVVTGVAQYPEGIIDRLKEARRTIVVEPRRKRKKMGAPKAFNVIVLGAAVPHGIWRRKIIEKVIETTQFRILRRWKLIKRHLRPVMRFLFRRTEAGQTEASRTEAGK